jgi:hypothetical protein
VRQPGEVRRGVVVHAGLRCDEKFMEEPAVPLQPTAIAAVGLSFNKGDANMGNENNPNQKPGQQSQNPGQKPGQQGGGQKPGQQQQDPSHKPGQQGQQGQKGGH